MVNFSGWSGPSVGEDDSSFQPQRDQLGLLSAFYDNFFEGIRQLNERVAAIDEPTKRLQEVMQEFQTQRGSTSGEVTQFSSAVIKTSISTRNFVRKLADTGLLEDINANIQSLENIKRDVMQRDKLLAEYRRSVQKLEVAREAVEKKLDVTTQERVDRSMELCRSSKEAFEIYDQKCRAAIDAYWNASSAVVDAHVKAAAISLCEFYVFAERAFESWRGFVEMELGPGGAARRATTAASDLSASSSSGDVPTARASPSLQGGSSSSSSRATMRGTVSGSKPLPTPPRPPPKTAPAAAAPPSDDPLDTLLRLDDVRIREGMRQLEDARSDLELDREKLRLERSRLEKEREALAEQRRRFEHEQSVEQSKLAARVAQAERDLETREKALQRREEALRYEQEKLAEEAKLLQERVDESSRLEQARQQREAEWRVIAEEKRAIDDKRRQLEEERVRKELEDQRRELDAQRLKLAEELRRADERREALEREEAGRRQRADLERQRRLEEAKRMEADEQQRLLEERQRMQREREALERAELGASSERTTKGREDSAASRGGVVVTAVFDYTAADETELSFKAGDRLTLLKFSESEQWWDAECLGRKGQIPSNYVESPFAKSPNPSSAAEKADSRAMASEEPPTRRMKAKFDYEAGEDSELSFRAGDILSIVGSAGMEGWLIGVRVDPSSGKSLRGQVPENFLE